MATHSSHILELARKGAEVRFRDLIDHVRPTRPIARISETPSDPDELPITLRLRSAAERPERKACDGGQGEKSSTESGRRPDGAC